MDAGLYQIIVESDDGREIFGEISFKIKKDRTWIHSISTEYRYQHQGVGQALIELCELCSAVKGMNKIEGLYCPGNEYAYPFYEKNGYNIEEEGCYLYIRKTIDIEKTIERIESKLDMSENDYSL
jgi:GNAT superfamily N-acetyltransferase